MAINQGNVVWTITANRIVSKTFVIVTMGRQLRMSGHSLVYQIGLLNLSPDTTAQSLIY